MPRWAWLARLSALACCRCAPMPSPYPCPATQVYVTDSSIVVDAPDLVQGKRVVLIEDGPTLTHGGMKYGAGKYAAEKYGAAEIVDPRPFLVRVIAAAFVWGGLRRALAPAPGACVHSAGGRCSLLTIQCCSVLPCPGLGPPGGLHAVHLPQAPAPGQADPRHGLLPGAGECPAGLQGGGVRHLGASPPPRLHSSAAAASLGSVPCPLPNPTLPHPAPTPRPPPLRPTDRRPGDLDQRGAL